MAIKFVDIEPDDGKAKRAEKVDAPRPTHEPDAERPGVSPTPYAKPAPKKRGRK